MRKRWVLLALVVVGAAGLGWLGWTVSDGWNQIRFVDNVRNAEPPAERERRIATHVQALKSARLETPTGEAFRLSEGDGRILAVSQFAHWCGPCIIELADLRTLQAEVGADRFAVVILSQEKDWDKDRAKLASLGHVFPHVVLRPDSPEQVAAIDFALPLPDGTTYSALPTVTVFGGDGAYLDLHQGNPRGRLDRWRQRWAQWVERDGG